MLAENVRESLINLLNDESYKPMSKKELVNVFAESEDDQKEFFELLDELSGEGKLFINKKGKVGNLESYSMKIGKYASTKRGFGFVEYENDRKDTFISEGDRNGAFNGDTVIVKITKSSTEERRSEGVIIRIINRANSEIIGVFQENKSFGFVIPDNKKFDQDIFIPKNYFSGAKNNDKVVCEVTLWPDDSRKPEGKIVEIIGKKGERFVEIDSIVRSHGLPDGFSEKVQAQATGIADHISEGDIVGRLDLRKEQIYTIDGDDSKDFDDAVNVIKLENGNFKLGVHIADVTNYVTENSPLDREALKRATSVYLVDKVIPMLPKELSNGICSLNPGVDRLTLSCIMEVDPSNGKVVKYDIAKSVINSKARMTYHKVSEILENNDPELCEEYKDFLENFKNAGELAKILRKRRQKRGAIDFDFPESFIKLDEKGVPIAIEPYERRTSNKLIEEFMLLANETIAEHYFWLKTPFVYRVHEEPDEDKMTNLRNFVNELGYKMPISRGDVRPSDLQRVLDSIDDKEKKQAVGTIMLRSLRQARYAPECLGHFGLAAKYYCHFTSPIRRYPDLQIHRIIKENLDGKFSDKRKAHYEDILEYVSFQSSTQERKADLAERDVDDYYKAVYMEDYIGEEFEGHISGITSFGIFVELSNGVEGLVKLHSLPDIFRYNEKSQTLVGENTGKVHRLGSKVKVQVENVNIDAKEIDFSLISH